MRSEPARLTCLLGRAAPLLACFPTCLPGPLLAGPSGGETAYLGSTTRLTARIARRRGGRWRAMQALGLDHDQHRGTATKIGATYGACGVSNHSTLNVH